METCSPHLILATAGFTEVSDRRKFRVYGTSVEPAIVQLTNGLLSILLAVKLSTITTHGHQRKFSVGIVGRGGIRTSLFMFSTP